MNAIKNERIAKAGIRRWLADIGRTTETGDPREIMANCTIHEDFKEIARSLTVEQAETIIKTMRVLASVTRLFSK